MKKDQILKEVHIDTDEEKYKIKKQAPKQAPKLEEKKQVQQVQQVPEQKFIWRGRRR